MYTYVYTYTYVNIHVHTRIYLCIYTNIYTGVNVYAHVQLCMHVYIYIYVCIDLFVMPLAADTDFKFKASGTRRTARLPLHPSLPQGKEAGEHELQPKAQGARSEGTHPDSLIRLK